MDPIPVRARFSTLVQAGPGGSPSLLYNGYQVSFPRVKQRGRGVDRPPPSSAEVKERVKLSLYSPSGRAFVAYSRVNLTFTFTRQDRTK